MNLLNEFKIQHCNNDISLNFNKYMILDAENKIVVEFHDFNDQTIHEFKNQVFNSDIIQFVEFSEKVIPEINAGSRVDSSTHMSSVGCRVRRNGVDFTNLTSANYYSAGGDVAKLYILLFPVVIQDPH